MLKKLTKMIIIGVLLLYLAICAFMYFKQTDLAYQPRASVPEWSVGYENQAIEFKHDGVTLRGWLSNQSSDQPFVFYYGGNAEEVSNKLDIFKRTGITNYLLLNYRGYGDSEGEPNEVNFKKDALFIYDTVTKKYGIDADRIILFGNSLGTGVATYVASERPAAKVILNMPYDSFYAVGQRAYPFLPVSLLATQRFDSYQLAPEIETPVLCIIAEHDKIIPPSHTRRLCGVWKGPVTTEVIKGAGHNDIYTFPQQIETIRQAVALVQ